MPSNNALPEATYHACSITLYKTFHALCTAEKLLQKEKFFKPMGLCTVAKKHLSANIQINQHCFLSLTVSDAKRF